jgi:CBS domain containing-hemolysin-like protein
LVEVVVGEISDLRDAKNLYTRSGSNEIIVSGRLEIEQFNDIFNTELISENNLLTIGGWLTEQLGNIPKSGTKYETQNLLFQVLTAEPNKITKIYVRKLHKKSGKTEKKEKRE